MHPALHAAGPGSGIVAPHRGTGAVGRSASLLLAAFWSQPKGQGVEERLGIAGSGAIACGLAATAAQHGEVLLWARSDRSADRARGMVSKWCSKLSEEPIADRVTIVGELDALGTATFLVEAVAEDHATKASVLSELG